MSEPTSGQGPTEGSEHDNYWQRQAAEAAASPPPPSPGPQFNQQSAYPIGDTPPAYPGPGATPYPQQYAPQYGQPQYAPLQYAPPAYGQPGYPQPAYGYPAPIYVPPDHPRAVAALVLGLVAGPGALMTCGLSLLVAPFAWYYGAVARKGIRQAPNQYGGQGKATTGFVFGILGTILLTLVLAGIIALIIWSATDPTGYNDYFDNGTTV